MNVIQTITAVKRDLGAVDKGKRMEAGPAKYQYRSIDDVLNKLHTGLVEHGLVFSPNVTFFNQEAAGETRSGTKQTRTILGIEYHVAGPEGDSFKALTYGEAIDSGDKGTNKASTAAFKVLLTQLLAIPFETDDIDDHFTEVVSSSVPGSGQKPKAGTNSSTQPKAQAGKAAGGETTPTAKPATKSTGGRTCPSCTYAIGPKDTVKKGPDRAFHHTACLEGKSDSSMPSADDIASIIGD